MAALRSRRRGMALVVTAGFLVLGAACGKSDTKAASGSTTSTGKASGAVAGGPIVIQAGINDPAQRSVAVLQYMPAKATVAVAPNGPLELGRRHRAPLRDLLPARPQCPAAGQ